MMLVTRNRDREAGLTLVELMVALMLSAIVGMMLVTWMTSAMRSANLHRDDDMAVQSLRESQERLTRELRSATGLINASDTSLTIWIDEDWDGEIDAGETVTWEVTDDGRLVRSTDDGDEWVLMHGLVPASSGFTLDGATVEDTRVVTIVLVASVGDGTGTRSAESQIFLRNAP